MTYFSAPLLRRLPSRAHSHRAFLVIDVVLGVLLALALIMAITAAAVKQRHAENQLAQVRVRSRRAEAALSQLQIGQAPPAGFIVNRVPDAAPAGYAWVRLTVPAAKSAPATTLVGLVPVKSLAPGKGTKR